MIKNGSSSYLGIRRLSQQFHSEKKSPNRTPQKPKQVVQADKSSSPAQAASDLRKPLKLITNSPQKPDVVPTQPFTFENRSQRVPTQLDQLLSLLKQNQEQNELLKKELEKQTNSIKEKEMEFQMQINQLEKLRLLDQLTIKSLKQQNDEMEAQLLACQESESRMIQPINHSTNLLMQRIEELEKQKNQYFLETSNLTQYLKEVLEQNKLLQTAYDEKNSELESLKKKKAQPPRRTIKN